MRAIQCEKFGGPEVLEYRTNVPIPEITDDQILIKVVVAAVNPSETWAQQNAYPEADMKLYVPSFPWTPGRDVAGTVEKVGANITRFKPGDRVYTACLTACGGYAEYVAAPDRETFPLPDSISFRDGACIGCPYYTAYRALHTRGHVKAGETVLMHGASGGVGIAVVQLAVGHGCRVIGTAGTKEGMDLVKAQGAHAVFNHKEPGYVDKIKEFTGGKGVNMIVELVADVNLDNDVKLLAKFGKIMVVGTTEWKQGTCIPRLLYMLELDIMGVAIGIQDDFFGEYLEYHHALVQGFKDGWLRAVIGIEYPLEKAAEAQREVREHKQGAKGKIIINI